MRNLLSSFTRHRHIIHAGYTFSGNGSWILQDGTFSVSDFAEAFQEHDVQRVLRAYPDTVSMDIHCDASAGLWNVLPNKSYAKTCKIRINPVDVLESSSDRIKAFIDYLAPMLNPASLNDLLESSDVVGNIRFSHPTLYVFPGGQGDAALFGINGFNMLVDGGFNRKACFWNFARHLDRLDAVLMTRINNSNIQGISSVIERKSNSHVYPGIGHFFCNIPERRAISSPEENKDKDSLVIDLFDKGQKIISNLKSISLKPQMCYRDVEPMNLYHKVGHGTLDMYVISPGKDSREVKEFMQKWTSNDQKLFAAKDTKDFQFPIQNLVSICALLVWQPANPEETITRILFPGSTPDYKIMEGLEKIKHLEFMKYPMCTAKKLVPSISTAAITKKVLKSAINEKSIPEPILPSKTTKTEKDDQVIDNKVKNILDNKTKESKLIEDEAVEKRIPTKAKPKKILPKKSDSLDGTENKDKDDETSEVPINANNINEAEKKDETDVTVKPKKLDQKSKVDTKATIKSRIDSKPPKSMDKKIIKRDSSEKKEIGKQSPTTTPKKTSSDPKLTNGVAKDKEIKQKTISKIMKSSPSSTPAKSTKEANNRKVLESKQRAKTIKREVVKSIDKKEEKVERKPVSHRSKGISPSRRPPDSPKKSIKPKTEKDNIIRKAKLDRGGTTDSSLVSTPSADDATSNQKIVDVSVIEDVEKQRELDDLKEEQEAVREIEEVFQREEKSKKKEISTDHRQVATQDSTTEVDEDDEYLIIEKEEVEQYTEDSINEQENSMTKEEEMQKHQRDSEESEKKRKSSLQITEEELEVKDEPKDEAEQDEINEQEQDDVDDVQPDSIEEVATGDAAILPAMEEGIKEEVQEIITSAKEIAKLKSESKEEVAKTEEISSPTPEEKLSSTKKSSETKDDLDPAQLAKDGEIQNLPESQPFSTTIESGATTAPTLPEDERIPLDEIKEDLVVEEKYIKEETKEAKEPQVAAPSILQKTYEPLERPVPTKMQFDTTQPHLRDIVKTPDEVADLPVHEEADIETYDASDEAKDDEKISEKADKEEAKEELTGDATDMKKVDKIPNGSVVNIEKNEQILHLQESEKEHEEHVEIEEHEHAPSKVKDEKLTIEKKAEVTEFKEKVSTTAEKIEYAVEDLGTSFENTLKDVTLKDDSKAQAEKLKEVVIDEQQSSEKRDDLSDDDNKKSGDAKEEAIPSETKATNLVDEVKEVCDTIISKIESLVEPDHADQEFKEVFDYSHPYGLKTFPTELRETHITTVDSPVTEKDKLLDLKVLDKLPEVIDEENDDLSTKSVISPFHPDDFKYASFEREDSNLKDIKEEEEEDRSSPPSNEQIAPRKESVEVSEITNKDTITALSEQPPRAVSPREEEVLKIVANVAEVLKSEKDISEIIPDFSEEELERKLRGSSPRLDDETGTVQRMLVTASSEDGGEEIEICPEGSIRFSQTCTPEVLSGTATPDPKECDVKSESEIKSDLESVDLYKKENMEIDLEKQLDKETSDASTPEAKTSTSSIEEKEKHELPEKAQINGTEKEKVFESVSNKFTTQPSSRKESVVSDFVDDVTERRESAFSAFSDKDITKDESSMDDSRPPSAVSQDLKTEKDEKDPTIQIKSADVIDVEKPISSEQLPEEKSENLKSKESPTLSDLKVEVSDERRESASSHVSDKSGTEISRPDSIISHFSDKSEPELKEKLGSSPDSITSIDKAMVAMESTNLTLGGTAIHIQNEITKTNISRQDSADIDKSEENDTLRSSSATSQNIESMEEASKKSIIQILKCEPSDTDTKKDIASSCQEDLKKSIDKVDQESLKGSDSPPTCEKKPADAISVEHKDDSRPPSAVSHASEKAQDKLPESRPLSATSIKADEEPKESPHDSRTSSRAGPTIDEETDRPKSALSDKADKESLKGSDTPPISEKKIEDAILVEHKDDSRPPSAVSHASEKAQDKLAESRPLSATSIKADEEPKESPHDSRTSSRADPTIDEETDRPKSALSDKADKESLKGSDSPPISEKKMEDAISVEQKDDSRPPSAVSHASEKAQAKLPESRPLSATSIKADEELKEVPHDSRASSRADPTIDEETDRPKSALSDKADKESLKGSDTPPISEKKIEDAILVEHKDDSRPPSAVSHASEKAQDKLAESRPLSATSIKADEEPKESLHDSRTSSRADPTIDEETDRPKSALSDKADKESLKGSDSPPISEKKMEDAI
ncbi:Microtubule-associated protein futsch, partial [Pseudolycoriella hygida]